MMRNRYLLQMIVIYVDDLLIIGSSSSSIVAMKIGLHDRFSMTYIGLLHYFLGLEIRQNDSGIKMSQSKYETDLHDRFHMTYCKPAPTPFQLGVRLEDVSASPLVGCTRYRQLGGSLLYLTQSRLDISYEIGSVSRYVQEPHGPHWKEAKRILIYVKGTTSFGIHYAERFSLDLIGYTYLYWEGDRTN
jgi:hypothetical protein